MSNATLSAMLIFGTFVILTTCLLPIWQSLQSKRSEEYAVRKKIAASCKVSISRLSFTSDPPPPLEQLLNLYPGASFGWIPYNPFLDQEVFFPKTGQSFEEMIADQIAMSMTTYSGQMVVKKEGWVKVYAQTEIDNILTYLNRRTA